jgi:hypothetical protein
MKQEKIIIPVLGDIFWGGPIENRSLFLCCGGTSGVTEAIRLPSYKDPHVLCNIFEASFTEEIKPSIIYSPFRDWTGGSEIPYPGKIIGPARVTRVHWDPDKYVVGLLDSEKYQEYMERIVPDILSEIAGPLSIGLVYQETRRFMVKNLRNFFRGNIQEEIDHEEG